MKRTVLALGLATAIVVTTVTPAAAATTALYVDPYSQATTAAASDHRLDALAAVPQGKWFTSWTSVASIENDISSYVSAADDANKMPVVVLYQIPGRDCGSYSAGGLPSDADYRAWIDGAARGLTGHPAIVVVEPDALAQLGNCATPGDRVGLLRYASQTIAATGARVYLDAGHSNWQAPAVMADRLVQAGVQYARGFSTNVANFQPTDAEVGYARAVSAELAARGVAGSHFVIDTGRNGAGSTGEVCNPPTARVGAAPKLLSSGALDAYLWIKTVGETDGACNGGPASGFSTALALALTKGAFLKAPTKPTAKLRGSKIAVTWKKRAGATAYQVIFTPKKGKAIVKVVKGTRYTLVKPKKKMTYKVQVTARGTSGYSTRSKATVVRTR